MTVKASPCVLIIAGVDPSGGAGIAADLRAVSAAGAWGCPVCAVLTVQSTAGLVSAQAIDAALVLEQAREVLTHDRVRSIKTGALGSAANVRAVAALLREHPRLPAVVDPVIVATRAAQGARLLDTEGGKALAELFSAATIITPNIDEAEELLATKIQSLDDVKAAARALLELGPRAVLVKGGHLKHAKAVDVLAFSNRIVPIATRMLDVPPFHGGGCTLASLIAGNLATINWINEESITAAVRFAKRTLTKAIRNPVRIGEGLLVLGV